LDKKAFNAEHRRAINTYLEEELGVKCTNKIADVKQIWEETNKKLAATAAV
jgi:hypothetical protein